MGISPHLSVMMTVWPGDAAGQWPLTIDCHYDVVVPEVLMTVTPGESDSQLHYMSLVFQQSVVGVATVVAGVAAAVVAGVAVAVVVVVEIKHESEIS